jgi:hypothetical protein
LTAEGGAKPYTWTIFSGRLPQGLSLDPETGAITGTPKRAEGVKFTAIVADSSLLQQQTAWSTFDAEVEVAPVTILTESFPPSWLNYPYWAQFAACGGTPPYTWSVAGGALPPGLELDPLTGRVTGVATQEGEFAFTIRVEDSSGPPASNMAKLRAEPAPH